MIMVSGVATWFPVGYVIRFSQMRLIGELTRSAVSSFKEVIFISVCVNRIIMPPPLIGGGGLLSDAYV